MKKVALTVAVLVLGLAACETKTENAVENTAVENAVENDGDGRRQRRRQRARRGRQRVLRTLVTAVDNAADALPNAPRTPLSKQRLNAKKEGRPGDGRLSCRPKWYFGQR